MHITGIYFKCNLLVALWLLMGMTDPENGSKLLIRFVSPLWALAQFDYS
jgi:hypothetical protein